MRTIVVSLCLLALIGLFESAIAGPRSRVQELIDRAKSQAMNEAGLAAPVETAPPGRLEEEFNINAQYRGTVKKAFMDIGKARVTYITHPGNKFTMKAAGSVTDPEDENYRYEIAIDADYAVEGNRIEILEDRSTFNEHAEKHRERLLRDIPFVYLAKYTAFPQTSRKQEPWRLGGHEYDVQTIRVREDDRDEWQVTVFERGNMIGKVFLLPNADIPHGSRKFRVIGTNDVVLSFVRPGF